MGPFIDSNHAMIKAGEVDMTPNELFCDKISRRLVKLIKASPSTNVILIPHARDLTSVHMSYPQSPLNRDADLRLPKVLRFHSVMTGKETDDSDRESNYYRILQSSPSTRSSSPSLPSTFYSIYKINNSSNRAPNHSRVEWPHLSIRAPRIYSLEGVVTSCVNDRQSPSHHLFIHFF